MLGLALILGGGLAVQGTNPYVLWLLAAGLAAHAGGWAVLPGRGWRRAVAGLGGLIAVLLLVAGPQTVWVLAFPYAGWLLVRERALPAWATLALPLASGAVLATLAGEYSAMPWALAIQVTVVIASAWLAALIDRWWRARGR